MLQLKNIDLWRGNNHILQNLSCHAQPGDFVVIVGGNGAGKSTFFDTIAGKVQPHKGSITLDGTDVTQLPEQERAGIIARIFQNTQLNCVGSMTVAQNLAMAHYSGRSAKLVYGMQAMPRARAEEIIQNIGMDPSILDKPMSALSGGQRQLIAFVMATQRVPKLLLLDEPTAALDPQAATKLLKYAVQFIKKYKITTLLITHDPHIALNMGNKIWILEKGTITKEYHMEEKRYLEPDKLIGQIDYAHLTP